MVPPDPTVDEAPELGQASTSREPPTRRTEAPSGSGEKKPTEGGDDKPRKGGK